MKARNTSIIVLNFGGNRTTHVGVRGWTSFFMFVTLRPSGVIEEKIASVFGGRFRRGSHFAAFFGEEKPFPMDKQIWKLSLGGATIGAPIREEIFKNIKIVRTTSTIYKRAERKLLPQHFTTCIVDVHSYKYFATSLQGATKNCQVRTGGTESVQYGRRLCAPKVY